MVFTYSISSSSSWTEEQKISETTNLNFANNFTHETNQFKHKIIAYDQLIPVYVKKLIKIQDEKMA